MSFQPSGFDFIAGGKTLRLVEMPEHPAHHWIVYQHPDGQWVTLRKATQDDFRTLAAFCRSRGEFEYEDSGFWESGYLHERAERYDKLAKEQ